VDHPATTAAGPPGGPGSAASRMSPTTTPLPGTSGRVMPDAVRTPRLRTPGPTASAAGAGERPGVAARQATQPHPWTGQGSPAVPATRSGQPAPEEPSGPPGPELAGSTGTGAG
jgi:translation initiation factor IF-2